jgi:hypothetical protein
VVELGDEAALLEEEVSAEGGSTEVGPGQQRLFELDSGLPTFLKWALSIAAVGVAALAVSFVDWMQQLVPANSFWLGWFVKGIDNGIKKGVQVLTSAIGVQYNSIDSEVGYGLHEIAVELRLLGDDIVAAGFTTYKLTQIVAALSHKPSLAPRIQRIERTVRPLPQKITETTRKVVYVTRIVPRAVPAHLTEQIHHLQDETKRQAVEIAALQKQVRETSHPSTLATAAEATALGLAGLGLNTLRCEGTRAFNNALCEVGPQGLGRLLSLLGLAGFALGLVELAEQEKGLIGDVTPIVKDIWRV